MTLLALKIGFSLIVAGFAAAVAAIVWGTL